MKRVARSSGVTRRDFLRAGGLLMAGAAATACTTATGVPSSTPTPHPSHGMAATPGSLPGTVGEVDHEANGFNPTDVLTDFDYGSISTLSDGRRLREWEIVSHNKDVEVVPGISFPAWTFNGRIPGPTLRCTEGDRLRIVFRNGSDHPHSMHFHGFHPAEMDGVAPSGLVEPGVQ